MLRSAIALATAVSLGGCSGNTGRGGGPMGSGLAITPADAVLDVANGGGAQLTYQVTDSGNDVTSHAVITIDDASLGTLAGATFTAAPNRAGVTHVRAS